QPISTLFPYTTLFRSKISVSAGQGTACGQSSWSGAVTRRVSAADLADLILITAREIQFRGYTDPRGIPLSQSEGMDLAGGDQDQDRKSTRLNSSHVKI